MEASYCTSKLVPLVNPCTLCHPIQQARGSVQILDSAADARAIIMEAYGAKCCISFAPSTSTSRAKLHQWGILAIQRGRRVSTLGYRESSSEGQLQIDFNILKYMESVALAPGTWFHMIRRVSGQNHMHACVLFLE
jgi:hypothetical protein